MKYPIRCGLLAFACGILLAGIAAADDDDINPNIKDGPSRAELFATRMRAELNIDIGTLGSSAAPSFFLPNDVQNNLSYGIDVSHYNDENCTCKAGQNCDKCSIDWSRVANQRVAFAYVKATDRANYRDPTFAYHWRAMAQQNIPRGAYHFMTGKVDPLAQANYFINTVERAGKMTAADLPPCLDLEDTADYWTDMDPDEVVDKVLIWLKRVEERTKRRPVIYTNPTWYAIRVQSSKRIAELQKYPIWISQYPASGSHLQTKPNVPKGFNWPMWQFTQTGRMKNADVLPGNLDVSVVNGSIADFQKMLGVVAVDDTEVARDDAGRAGKAPEQVASKASGAAVDTGKAPVKVAEINPAQQNDASKQTQQQAAGGGQAAQTDPRKLTTQAAANPASSATEAAKQSPPATTATSGQPVETGKPVQQASAANASAATDAAKAAQQSGANASQPPEATKTAQQSVAAVSQAVAGAKAEQPAPAGNAAPAQDAGKTQDASKTPEAGKTPAQTAAATPVEQKAPANPAAQPDGAAASEAAQKASGARTSSGRSAARSAAQRAAAAPADKIVVAENAAPAAAATVAASTAAPAAAATAASAAPAAAASNAAARPAPAGEKIMIEIDLLNGRKLRVDANIDPAVLAKLIAAIDK